MAALLFLFLAWLLANNRFEAWLALATTSAADGTSTEGGATPKVRRSWLTIEPVGTGGLDNLTATADLLAGGSE